MKFKWLWHPTTVLLNRPGSAWAPLRSRSVESYVRLWAPPADWRRWPRGNMSRIRFTPARARNREWLNPELRWNLGCSFFCKSEALDKRLCFLRTPSLPLAVRVSGSPLLLRSLYPRRIGCCLALRLRVQSLTRCKFHLSTSLLLSVGLSIISLCFALRSFFFFLEASLSGLWLSICSFWFGIILRFSEMLSFLVMSQLGLGQFCFLTFGKVSSLEEQ